ncbi:MAG TPA: single-stranded DNA-binding protein [Solirubrobacteraceae bacterium]|jgi:single-strand DNA-binding protein|nr:single-stranded DNA-binding protein [Solirubrobacteraceae bacterium]
MSYSNINRVVLVGRLTADPELRALPSGTTVCNLRLACNGVRKNADGEYAEKPNFFNVSVYGAQGESVHRYMARGGRLAVDGRLEWREWETAEALKRQTVEIVADSVEFLDGSRPNGSLGDSTVGGSPAGEFDVDSDDGGEERELVGVGSGIEDDVTF